MDVTAPPEYALPHRRSRLTCGALVLVAALAADGRGQPPHPSTDVASALDADRPAASPLTREAQEAFLRKARIVRSRAAPNGTTGSRRVTLSDGVLTHDAHVQSVDEARTTFQGRREVELNFRDTWRYNVAAYRLSLLLDLDMIPVSVERTYQRDPASFTWWVDDVMMDEGTRLKEKRRAPDVRLWNQQMAVVRVFDQLIYNTDRNLGNLLITSDWQLWMIDHTRAFRQHRTLRASKNLTSCDRQLLTRLEALDKGSVQRELSRWLEAGEIDALLGRRDVIVQWFRGASPAALFDLSRRPAAPQPEAARRGQPWPGHGPRAEARPSAATESGPRWQ